MQKIMIAAILAALAGCGGGGDSAPTASIPVATISAPAISPKATTVGGASTDISANGQDYLVKFAGVVGLTVSGQINNVWIADGQAAGAVTIGGSGNVVVFRPGATVGSLTVTGASNTIYLPVGSAIKVEGSAAASATVKYYT